MHRQQQHHVSEEPSLAELEQQAEREAAEAEARARSAETARERFHAAKQAHRAEQLAPVRQRERELAAALAVIDDQAQAIVASALAEARALYREARALFCERQAVTNAALALGAGGFGESVPTFERFVVTAIARFRDRNPAWEDVSDD